MEAGDQAETKPALASNELAAGVVSLRLRGEHDLYRAPELRAALTGALANGSSVVVDLRAATFIDSAAAAALVEARKEAKRLGLGLALLLSDEPTNEVRRMFESSGLISIFVLASSDQDAVDRVRVEHS